MIFWIYKLTLLSLYIITCKMGNCISSKNKPQPKKKKKVLNKVMNKSNPYNTAFLPKNKKNIPKSLKKMVWDKYVGADIGKSKCMCCKYEEIRQIEFHCGHIIAEANGGETNINNLRPICAQCNLSMGKMNMDIFMKKYMANKN